MKIQRQFDEKETLLVQKLESMPVEELKRLLDTSPPLEEEASSKWERYATEAPAPLLGLGEFVMECAKNFRDDFIFKHDLEEEAA